MFLTARVTVLSAAKAAGGPRSAKAKAANVKSRVIGFLRSSVEKQGCHEVETERGNHQQRGQNERGLDEPVRQLAYTGRATGAGGLRGAIDEPVAAAEKRERGGDDIGLIGGELGQVADPRPAHAET